jgi:futalosine hydrolase
MIAIVAAVPDETCLLRRRLFPCEVKRCGHRDLYCGRMFGHKVVVLHTGVGKVNAASAVTALLEHCRPDSVVVAGCCGAYPGQGLDIGDLLLASEEICADEGVLTPEGFKDFASLGFPLLRSKGIGLHNRFAADGRLFDLAGPILQYHAREEGVGFGIGPLVTISTCSGTLQAGVALQQRTGGLAENMEGAAVAQVCKEYRVPFLELRGVSNMVEDRNPANWDVKTAVERVQQALIALLRGWFSPVMLA